MKQRFWATAHQVTQTRGETDDRQSKFHVLNLAPEAKPNPLLAGAWF
jgi:hypothetical protein